MATVTPKPLVQGTLLGATDATLYTVPAATVATVRSYTLTNNDTVDRTVTVRFVVSAGVPGDANTVLNTVPVKAKETLIDDTLRVLSTGDFISAFADVATKVAFRVDGSEIT
jgi:hypothetical protein